MSERPENGGPPDGRTDWPSDWPAEVADDLAAAAAAALAGGVAARPHYRDDDLGIRHKTPGDPVTEADHAANDAILRVLSQRRPGDVVRSEESAPPKGLAEGGAGNGARAGNGPRAGNGARLWVVDPLDGTKEFIARNGEFAMMVGLAVDGAARLGAVLKPDPGRLYVGLADGGAWVADVEWDAGDDGEARLGPFRRLRLSGEGRRRPRLVRSRSHPDPLITAVRDGLEAEEILSGSVGVKCSLIAEERADVYVHPVPFLKEWDTCAPEAVLRGAGGRVTDCGGAPLSYGKPDPLQPRGIFAGQASAWENALPLVREVTADKLGPYS